MLGCRRNDPIIFFMRFQLRHSALLLVAIAVSYSASPQRSTSQAEIPHVVLTKLFPPVYPPLAQEALIQGDVKVDVTVHPDGTVEDVIVISGHPMLIEAAIDSSKQSQFECRGCGASNARLHLTFSFQPSPKMDPNPCCCSRGPANPGYHDPPQSKASQMGDHITVTGRPPCMCPDACEIAWAESHSRFRSAKCLYLWKCGRRFIGLQ